MWAQITFQAPGWVLTTCWRTVTNGLPLLAVHQNHQRGATDKRDTKSPYTKPGSKWMRHYLSIPL